MTSFPPWYWLPHGPEDLERTAAELLAKRMPQPEDRRGAVPRWLLEELNPAQVRIALDFRAMGLPVRLGIAKALGLTPEELDLYEAGREVGDEGILERIAEERR